MVLEPKFLAIIRSTFGSKGESWLTQLPRLLEEFGEKWHLTLLSPFQELSFNYVATALKGDGKLVVLKLGVPNVELTSEIEALKVYDGRGAVRLLEADAERGALLLERLQPGRMLSTLVDDEKATRIAANVLKILWRQEPANHQFKSIADWARGLDKISTLFPNGIPIPTNLIEQAKSLFADLLPTQTSKMLLHGIFTITTSFLPEMNGWPSIPRGSSGNPSLTSLHFSKTRSIQRIHPSPEKSPRKGSASFARCWGSIVKGCGIG